MVQPNELKKINGLESPGPQEKPLSSAGVSPEQFPLPEKSVERFDPFTENESEGDGNQETAAYAPTDQGRTQDVYFAQREKQIEKILEDGLADIYAGLPQEKKQLFRITGEKTAHQINLLLNETKIQLKKIISLIKEWLKLIPGVNSFFLEQEAKIKADELIKLKESKE